MDLAQAKRWYAGLQPRERMLVSGAAGLIVIAFLFLIFFGPFAKALNTRRDRVEAKRQDLAWMRSVSNAVRISAATSPVGNNESLVVLVNRTAQQSNVATAITNQTPQGETSIRVRLDGVSFDALVGWVGLLEQQYGVKVDSANLDRTDKTGVINATMTFARGAPGGGQ